MDSYFFLRNIFHYWPYFIYKYSHRNWKLPIQIILISTYIIIMTKYLYLGLICQFCEFCLLLSYYFPFFYLLAKQKSNLDRKIIFIWFSIFPFFICILHLLLSVNNKNQILTERQFWYDFPFFHFFFIFYICYWVWISLKQHYLLFTQCPIFYFGCLSEIFQNKNWKLWKTKPCLASI